MHPKKRTCSHLPPRHTYRGSTETMSAVRSAAHPPVRLVPISPAALQPPSAVVKMNCPPALQYRTQLFSLSLYPLHARIDQPRQNRMPPVLGPPWLPFPPSPDTHNARHIRRYRELMYDIEHKTPRLYASILISKFVYRASKRVPTAAKAMWNVVRNTGYGKWRFTRRYLLYTMTPLLNAIQLAMMIDGCNTRLLGRCE